MTRAVDNAQSVNRLLEHMRGFEGDIRRVYSDHRGIPTIGIGYALVIEVQVNGVSRWQLRDGIAEDFRAAGIFNEGQTLSENDLSILRQAVSALNGERDEHGNPIENPITTALGENDAQSLVIHTAQGWSFQPFGENDSEALVRSLWECSYANVAVVEVPKPLFMPPLCFH